MIIQDPEKKRELDKIPDADENGDPIYKIDSKILSVETDKPVRESAITDQGSKYRGTPQDLKDETSQD